MQNFCTGSSFQHALRHKNSSRCICHVNDVRRADNWTSVSYSKPVSSLGFIVSTWSKKKNYSHWHSQWHEHPSSTAMGEKPFWQTGRFSSEQYFRKSLLSVRHTPGDSSTQVNSKHSELSPRRGHVSPGEWAIPCRAQNATSFAKSLFSCDVRKQYSGMIKTIPLTGRT